MTTPRTNPRLSCIAAAVAASVGLHGGDEPRTATPASAVFIAEANAPLLLSRDVLQMATTRALGASSVFLLEGGIVTEADQSCLPDLQDNIDRLHEMDEAFAAAMDPAEAEDMQIVYLMGAEDARLGVLTIDELAAAARMIVQLDAEIATRAEAAVAFMETQRMAEDQVLAMAARTRVIMATGGPDLMLSDTWAAAPGEDAMIADIAHLWGGLGEALSTISAFTDLPEPVFSIAADTTDAGMDEPAL